jgi:peptide/nickel transport system substrate-binding protein
MHCPNDRYVNDEALCAAIVQQLAPVGVRVNLVSQTRAQHFPMIQADPPQVDMYLLGWGVPTFDSAYIFSLLYHTRTDKLGTWNGTRYSNPDVDRLIEGLSTETDLAKRTETMQRLWARLADELIYIPIHIQTIAYAMRADIDLAVDVLNQPKLKQVKFRKAGG